jgi:hypothetical protein
VAHDELLLYYHNTQGKEEREEAAVAAVGEERREGERPATALLNCNVLGAHTVVCGGHSQIFGLRGERESAISRRTLSLALSLRGQARKGSFFADNRANKAKKIKGNPANCAPRAG